MDILARFSFPSMRFGNYCGIVNVNGGRFAAAGTPLRDRHPAVRKAALFDL
jgi:hypothetical protein